MARRRSYVEAERERDIAIEEAAVAYLELNQLRVEVETLRREKAAWESGRDVWSRRHEQILSHVSAMAEVVWSACQQRGVSVEEARLLALESFAQLPPKDDAQVYEEMHDLYATIAHMENQQTKLGEKLRDLKRLNDELVEKNLWCEETHDRAVASATKNTRDELGLEAIHPLPEGDETVPDLRADGTSTKSDSSDTATIELLQAQLTMYINYSKRHNHPPR